MHLALKKDAKMRTRNLALTTLLTLSVIATNAEAVTVDSGDYYEGIDRNAEPSPRNGVRFHQPRQTEPNPSVAPYGHINSGDYYNGAVRPN
jgi:hypothetical protein